MLRSPARSVQVGAVAAAAGMAAIRQHAISAPRKCIWRDFSTPAKGDELRLGDGGDGDAEFASEDLTEKGEDGFVKRLVVGQKVEGGVDVVRSAAHVADGPSRFADQQGAGRHI